MRRKLRIPLIGVWGCCWMLAIAGKTQAQGAVTRLHLLAKAGQQLLVAGDSCINSFGETFTVRNFRYYLSHIQLADSAGNFYQATAADTYLVDLPDSASAFITLTVKGPVHRIRFLLGVDSLTNTQGVQTGVLDPARGMFWTWNSGYIMAKLEGRSPQSTAPGLNFTYHIGGYRTQQQTARWITLEVPAAMVGKDGDITLAADILQWFGGNGQVTIAAHPVCHEPGSLAVLIADNYARMFSVVKEGGSQP